MTNNPFAEYGIKNIPDMLGISKINPLLDLQLGSALPGLVKFSEFLPDLGITLSPSVTSMALAAQSYMSNFDWVSQVGAVNAFVGSGLSQMISPIQAESQMAVFGREAKASMDLDEIMRISDIGESFFASATQSIFTSLDTSFIDDLLGQAKSFDMGDLAFDDLDEGFFAQQPELIQSIEQLHQFSELSAADRLVLVRFIKVIVTLAVTLGLLEVSTDLPVAGLILACLGFGGMPVGHFVGEVANKALTPKALDDEA